MASREECERRLGVPCETLAYPYGDVDRRVAEAAMAAGYAGTAALSMSPELPTPFCWPRVGVYQVDGPRSFKLKVSPSFRRLQRSRAWAPISAGVRPFRPSDPAVS